MGAQTGKRVLDDLTTRGLAHPFRAAGGRVAGSLPTRSGDRGRRPCCPGEREGVTTGGGPVVTCGPLAASGRLGAESRPVGASAVE